MDAETLLDWIRCPQMAKRKTEEGGKRFDHRRLYRTMVLGALKAAYAGGEVPDRKTLAAHSDELWEYLLLTKEVPHPLALIEKMKTFGDLRRNCLDAIGRKQGEDFVNRDRWWDAAMYFDSGYYRLRDEINAYQGLLGLPDWQLVRAFYREDEYLPLTLADAWCDTDVTLEMFAERRLPGGNIRFDVPLYLDLPDIRLKMRIDILWIRERAYRKNGLSLRPGPVAEVLVPLSHFAEAGRIRCERQILRDLRLPLAGADYLEENGEKIRLSSVSVSSLAWGTGLPGWSESDFARDRKALGAVLADIDRSALICSEMSARGLCLRADLVKNSVCASCSFLTECHDRLVRPGEEEEETPGWKLFY